jgi:hypothetical protein
MKKRIILIKVFCLIANLKCFAQYTHSITFNGTVFANFFNKEVDNVNFSNIVKPNISYELKKNQWYLKLFNQYYSNVYYKTEIDIPDSSIISARNIAYGISVNHNLAIVKSKFSTNLSIGLIYNRYTSYLQYWFYNGPVFQEGFGEFIDEKKFGIIFGVNNKLMIYKNVFINADFTLNIYPGGIHNLRNYAMQLGIGYRQIGKVKKHTKGLLPSANNGLPKLWHNYY